MQPFFLFLVGLSAVSTSGYRFSEVSAVGVRTESALLTVSSSEVPHFGPVEVCWRLVESHPTNATANATAPDWIGVYSPPESLDDRWVDWVTVPLTGDSDQKKCHTFVLPNLRSNYQFRFFKGLEVSKHYQLPPKGQKLAMADVAIHGAVCSPTQAHLGLTGLEDRPLRLEWVSDSTLVPTVFVDGAGYSTGESSTYSGSDLCGEPAKTEGFRSPGIQHDVMLPSLKPDHEYTIHFGSGNDTQCWRSITVRSPPAFGQTAHLLVYGDMGTLGTTPDSDCCASWCFGCRAVIDEAELELQNMQSGPGGAHTSIMLIGDLAYSNGKAVRWELFQQHSERLALRAPFMVGLGNHEESGSFGECAVPYFRRYHMPSPVSENKIEKREPWYSFKQGRIHTVTLASYRTLQLGSPQYEWFVADLASVDRNKTPWIVLMIHHTVYHTELFHMEEMLQVNLRKVIEPLLMQYKVNAVISGHYHSYARTCPVAWDQCQGTSEAPRAPVYITVGTAGFRLDKGPCREDLPWHGVCIFKHGFFTLRDEGETLRGRFHGAGNKSVEFEVLDEFIVGQYAPALTAAKKNLRPFGTTADTPKASQSVTMPHAALNATAAISRTDTRMEVNMEGRTRVVKVGWQWIFDGPQGETLKSVPLEQRKITVKPKLIDFEDKVGPALKIAMHTIE